MTADRPLIWKFLTAVVLFFGIPMTLGVTIGMLA